MLRVIVIGLALITTPAMAQKSLTGNDMLRHCSRADDSAPGKAPLSGDLGNISMQGICVGAVGGMRYLANDGTTQSEHATCIPSAVTNGQALSVVVRYLRNHPERLHEQFESLVLAAFVEAWPCKR